jgi:transcription elongation factor GreB
MSKAFTSEETELGPLVVAPRAPLPPSTPNYVTPRGLELLRAERRELQRARASIEALLDDAQRAAQLAAWAARVRELDQRLSSAELVAPSSDPPTLVRFGSRVTTRDSRGRQQTYSIVGVDEADPATGCVAFVSPLARALLGARVDDEVHLHKPSSDETLEVVAIE